MSLTGVGGGVTTRGNEEAVMLGFHGDELLWGIGD